MHNLLDKYGHKYRLNQLIHSSMIDEYYFFLLLHLSMSGSHKNVIACKITLLVWFGIFTIVIY